MSLMKPLESCNQIQASGFKAVNRVFDHWGLNASQKMAILRLPKATFYKYTKTPDKINLDDDQMERLSYVLNIHASLRTVFTNRENIYGFIKMPNDNAFFNGRTPLSIIEKGSFSGLYEVSKQIDALRGAQW